MLHSLRVLADGHAPQKVIVEAHSLQEAIEQAEHQVTPYCKRMLVMG